MKNIFLVDADDTILDFHGGSELALKELFEEFSIPWKEEYLLEYRRINEGLWAALERKEMTRDYLMSQRFHIYFSHMGMLHINATAFNEKYIDMLSNRPIWFEGAEKFLQELRKMGRIYIVTNGTADVQKSRFTICKLYEKTDGVFVSQEIGADKPDPRFTNFAMENIPDFDKKRAIWIGDSLSADIKAAQDAQIDSIWLNMRKKSRVNGINPTYECATYEEILNILKRI